MVPRERALPTHADTEAAVLAIPSVPLRAGGVMMLISGARYTSIRGARVGDLQTQRAGMQLTIRHDKCTPLSQPRRFFIIQAAHQHALAPYALPPERARQVQAGVRDYTDLPYLVPLPRRWPGRGVGVGARALRGVFVQTHLDAGDDPQELAMHTGHTLRTQQAHYRTTTTPAERACGYRRGRGGHDGGRS